MKKSILILSILLSFFTLQAQDLTQVLRGRIVDSESNIPIIGASVVVLNSDPFMGTSTDIDGYYKLIKVPVGRKSLKITAIGYETIVLNDILITSGKEKVLELKMIESFTNVEEVTIKASKNTTRARNEMASVSSKSFSVEETQRYAASADDPARMAANYAGVSNAGDDFSNDISIRGNSPKGLLWRMEGIEIPNPNHFGSDGGSGGGISMISSSTMSTSDFYTGAFPAEFGNALSGVFDINLRTGNNETQEASFKLGTLGIEASTEGPFSKKSKASYLINYRYSSLALIDLAFPSLFGGVIPVYQDLSFKIKVPTKKIGTFTLFGLGGISGQSQVAKADSSLWETNFDAVNYKGQNTMGVVGLKHNIILSNKSYLKTILSASVDNYKEDVSVLVAERNYKDIDVDRTDFKNASYRLSSLYNHKFSKKSTLRVGAIGSLSDFNYLTEYYERDSILGNDTIPVWRSSLKSKGYTFFTQAFAQWKYRISPKFTLNAGVHFSHLSFNNTWAIDPRASIEYKINPASSLTLSAGLHSKPEHISTYLINKTSDAGNQFTPNKNLKFTQSAQVVLGYKQTVFKNIQLAFEPYFQYQFNVPIEQDVNSAFSIVNTSSLYEVMEGDSLINKGTGINYGLDITIQKPLSKLYYYMLTASIYQSKYKTQTNKFYDTRYSGLFSINAIGGKEFKIGKKKRNLVGINGKFLMRGGNRFTPVDLEASKLAGEEVLFEDRPFSKQARPYYRFDLGLNYKINSKSLTHTFLIDLQNVTNNTKNIFNTEYNAEKNRIEENYQIGIFPFISYKLEFKAKSKI